MEYETEKQSGVWDRLKESPRTVSALIIILVVAAAIYAFSGNETAEPNETPAQQTVEGEAGGEASPSPDAAGGAPDQTQMMTPAPVARETISQQSQALPQVERTGEGYVEKAQAGNGMTHLARRAATRWLAENNPGYSVTNEHRIYIEDYIQKKMGSPRLEVDESQTISFALVEEAVKAAGELTPAGLNNLSQYTYVLD